jgi:hypothetical protein
MTSVCIACNKIVYERNFESHKQIAGRYAPWQITNGAEDLVLQTLQSLKRAVCRKLPGGAGVGHDGPNQCFVVIMYWRLSDHFTKGDKF